MPRRLSIINKDKRKTKICSQCTAVFGCYTENCWCNTLPHVMPMNEKEDCLCPVCLKKVISKKIEEAETKNKLRFMSKDEMIENIDYYYNEQGYWVFTERYHLKRGFCCERGCRHCPYNFKKQKT